MTDPDKKPDPKPKRPMSNARISGMVATAVLVALFVFVGWFIWVAG